MADNEEFTDKVAALLLQEAGTKTEEPETEADEPTPEADAEPEQEFELPDMTPELPEDLAAELAEAAIEDEPEEDEPEYEAPETTDWQDPDTARLQAELKKAQKRAAHLEKEKARLGSRAWAAEAERYFPLSAGALDKIEAKSRRDFLRQAQAIHDQFVPAYEQIKAAFTKAREKERETLLAELKEEAEKAWGKGSLIPESMGTDSLPQQQLKRRRRAKSLAGEIANRLKEGSHVAQ